METHTDKGLTSRPAPDRPSAVGIPRSAPKLAPVQSRPKPRPEPFSPKPTLLLDIAPADEPESSDAVLQQLLQQTDAYALQAETAKKRWQFITLVLAMLCVPAVAGVAWLYSELNSTKTALARLQIASHSLTEQLDTSAAKVAQLARLADAAKQQLIQPIPAQVPAATQVTAAVTPALIVPAPTPAAPVAAPIPPAPTHDQLRLESIRKGTYPLGLSKNELIAGIGEPDRVYKSEKYEQLVYFGRSPGRFWFIGNGLIQVAH